MEAALQDYLTAQQNRSTNLNSNVKVGDTYAFINQFGIAKPYKSVQDFNSTAGQNSCGSTTALPLERTWADIKYPQGTPMVSGGPCGYENTYITASFPSSIHGATMLAGMTQMGNVGYVDVDNTYHSINSSYSSAYKSPITSYIDGKNMISCLGGKVHYGDPIHFKFDGSLIQTVSNVLKTSTGASIYFLQPTKGTSTEEIKYGDSFLLATTNVPSTSTCGTWGCKVGSISTVSKIELASGANSVPFKFIPLISDKMNTPIKINDQMSLVAYTTTNTMIDDTLLTSSSIPYLTSKNGAYTLKFTSGVLAVYNSSGSVKTTLYTMTSPSTTSYALFTTGKITFYSSASGSPVGMYPAASLGSDAPFKAVLCNDGTLVIVNNINIIKWPATATEYDASDKVYATELNSELVLTDYPDYRLTITSPLYGDGTSCNVDGLKEFCTDSSTCIGFIHSSTNHNWQFITKNDSASHYQMSDTPTNAYLREQTIDISGANCPTTRTITDVPWYHMLLLPKGNALPTGPCPAIPPIKVPSYNTYLSNLNSTWNGISPIGSTVFQSNINNVNNYNTKLTTSTANYNNAYNNVINTYTTDDPINNTLKQRIEDSSVLDEHFKGMAILWGVISVSIVAIIIFRPNN